MSIPKFQIPLSTPFPLSPSLQTPLINHLLQYTTTIPNLLDSLQTTATETGFSDRIAARAREIADTEENEGKEVDANTAVKRIVGEIMATLDLEETEERKNQGGAEEKEEGGKGVEVPKEMIEAANKIVREGLEQVVEIEVREEKEARENGWI